MDPILKAVSSSSVSTILLSAFSSVILKLLKYGTSMHVVKELRKLTLTSLGIDEIDREAKKQFKYAVLKLVNERKLLLKDCGSIQIIKNDNMIKRHPVDRVKEKNSINEKIDKKRKIDNVGNEEKITIYFDKDYGIREKLIRENNHDNIEKLSKTTISHESSMVSVIHAQRTTDKELTFDFAEKRRNTATTTIKKLEKIKNMTDPYRKNNDICTRIFVGNLPFSVDEISLETFLSPNKELLKGAITHVMWITDKKTQKFYGSAFVEMKNSVYAAIAVKKNGTRLMQRPIRVNYAPARDKDVWPPKNSVVIGGFGVGEQKQEDKRVKCKLQDKPKGCKKLFIGNLSYDINENEILKLFSTVEVQFKTIRWLHHIDTGEFKGCGFVEFSSPNSCEKVATLNGTMVLGRPIKIDWAT